MKLIIDINEELYRQAVRDKDYHDVTGLNDINDYSLVIAQGIPYEERPKGKWAKTGQSFVNPNKFRNFCCSNCLWELDEHIRIEPNFCPNCGADMKGGAV